MFPLASSDVLMVQIRASHRSMAATIVKVELMVALRLGPAIQDLSRRASSWVVIPGISRFFRAGLLRRGTLFPDNFDIDQR